MSKKELERKEFSMFSDVFDCCNIDDDIEVYDIVTVGHKVFIFWDCYNYFGCYTYGNGSYEDCYKGIVGQVEENLKGIKERLDK